MTTPHLDDEALSAVLDGAATAAELAHLSSCSVCRAQVEPLAAVARAVGAPVAPRPPSEIDHAIERAMSARPEPAPAPAETARLGPTPLRAAAGRRSEQHRGGPPRWLGAAAGIAAAVIVVGGGVALSRRGSSHTSTTAGLGQPAYSPTSPAPQASASAAASALAADLGDQSDPAALARQLTAAVAPRTGPAEAAGAVPPAPGSTTANSRATRNDQQAAASCVAEAARASGVAGAPTPVVVAPLRWRGEPAVAVVFSQPSGLAGAVMRRADCSLLAVLPF